jgi:hypothetical protein
VTGSRFLPPTPSRFLQKVATFAHAAAAAGQGIATRFLGVLSRRSPQGVSGHRALQRVVRRVPIVTKFMAFFVPEELKLDTPAPVNIGERPVPHVTPVYNRRARRAHFPRLG